MADIEVNLTTTNPQELIGQGIRAHAIGDFSNAAAAFGCALQLLTAKNGDEHDSLGEIYVHYARSLLELYREESGPLGEGIPQEDEEDSDDEDEETPQNGKSDEDANKTDDKPETNEEVKEDANKTDDKDKTNEEVKTEEKKTGEEDKKTEKENGDTSKTDENPEETEEQTNGEPSEQEKDPEDLQLAWEVLEVAKKIFLKREVGKEHLAETFILLGEIAMECGNFEEGFKDMISGITMQKEIFEPTSRKLAESYYKLGIFHSTASNIEEAVENFNNSIEILKNRIKFLKESIDKAEEKKAKRDREEIEEMGKLILEIEEKIADTKSIKEEMAAEFLKEIAGSADSKPKATQEEKPSSSKANDISHLVKRKRKAEEEPAEKETQIAKKPTP